RGQRLLEEMESAVFTAEELRAWRAIEVLEKTGTTQARHVLEQLSRGAPGARITDDARRAVQRLEGK
ncbi:MAG: hypothetical protein L0215_06990, partial [Gemmataceae bacterium]|nr:hypothetical protein [Gemmataceae bacterium]